MINTKSMLLLVLMLPPYVGAQNITINVHKVALVDVLYELAEAAKTGLALICNSVGVDCQYTQQGLVVGAVTDASNTKVLPLHTVKLNYGDADTILLALQSAQSMLSPTWQLLADGRSQQIFVYDDDMHAATLVKAIKQLDQPLKQMLIESRIVIAKSSLGESSGLDFIGGLGPGVALEC